MTKALHPCRTCEPDEAASDFIRTPGKARVRGWTRHRDRVCSTCRREGRHPGRVRALVGAVLTLMLALSLAAPASGEPTDPSPEAVSADAFEPLRHMRARIRNLNSEAWHVTPGQRGAAAVALDSLGIPRRNRPLVTSINVRVRDWIRLHDRPAGWVRKIEIRTRGGRTLWRGRPRAINTSDTGKYDTGKRTWLVLRRVPRLAQVVVRVNWNTRWASNGTRTYKMDVGR